MPLAMCPLCTSEDEVHLLGALADGRRRVECRDCNFQWDHGEARTQQPPRGAGTTLLAARAMFPTAGDVTEGRRAHALDLKRRFLSEVQPEPDPKVAPYWAHYKKVFSAQELPTADPHDLKRFANDPTGVYSGIMTVFNNAWNADPAEGARLLRLVINHLLRGPGELEERLTDLILGRVPYSMPGFKEALLTKVLCVTEPDRFVTIVTYDQKRIMASAIYGLDLPPADRVTWTIGRLIVWSNDLLRDLTGDGFVDQQHSAHFLWWAKDQQP